MAYSIEKKTRKGAKVKVVCKPGRKARRIELVGDFTEWQKKPLLMRRNANGEWTKVVEVPQGEHEYKFLVDGEWWVDPETTSRRWNDVGSENSVMNLQ